MGKPVEMKRKKKGRPSLLDLQKRSLRLQKQQEQQQREQRQLKRNPNPNSNPYARFPNTPPVRLTHRSRNPDPEPPSPEEDVDDASVAASVEDDEDEDEPAKRRKEKKLKLVLHLPHADANSSDAACVASESDGAATKRRKIDAAGKAESKNSSWKATEASQGDRSDLGPTTALPDKKLLEFILDRLQKKDTYGVFSEPVDPEELPDYHGIIEHPMDFGTVRRRLSSGDYRNLEHFEKDVFLISSNAMRYNASDTIYFRQARSIHELAKKSFENLRQESDDNNDPEPKIARRGRPPGTGKNNINRPVGRPPAERAGSEFSSEASLANASNGNLSSSPMTEALRRGSGFHKPDVPDLSAMAPQCFQSSDSYILNSEHKLEKSEDFSGTTIVAGSVWKGPSKSGKKLSAKDENWRDTHKQYQLSSTPELPARTAPAGDRKILVPVGLHVEFAYARSLARFAANLGPIGWKLAAKRIEKALPPGTKFGPGWVGESDHPRPPQCGLFLTPSLTPSLTHSNVSTASRDKCSEVAEQECHFKTSPSTTSVASTSRISDSNSAKASSQLHQITMLQAPVNGFKAPFSPSMYQLSKFATPNATPSNFGL
ncbi:bromodomain-containing protein DDB_G0270170 isoform X2 [Dendrobium catenatum]|uniref:Transcription factor GTE11 n=1 Tax=Dendrobium catenatum TaxID=906689 RepID=A0A2I0WIJ9_9ASPA|nr:bromodomain-containing protein DDB_G0270170 isoform X2 [Dendrobium catenatum]PKU75486.1 Transcription factor GTE11 [Dendrobium catenatum]